MDLIQILLAFWRTFLFWPRRLKILIVSAHLKIIQNLIHIEIIMLCLCNLRDTSLIIKRGRGWGGVGLFFVENSKANKGPYLRIQCQKFYHGPCSLAPNKQKGPIGRESEMTFKNIVSGLGFKMFRLHQWYLKWHLMLINSNSCLWN